MSANPAVFCQLEQSIRSATSDGTTAFSGWIFGASPSRCCSVRARSASRVAHGMWGLPRPDVAAAYLGESGAPYSGFCIECHGFNQEAIWLEWLDGNGSWHEFWRDSAAFKRRASAPPMVPSSLLPALPNAVVTATRSFGWKEAWTKTSELILDRIGKSTPVPEITELSMHLDEPAGETFDERFLPVSGWIFSTNSQLPVRRLFANVDPGGSVYLIFPKPRPDVIAAFPDASPPLKCGFEGRIMLPATLPSFLYLRLYAELADGTTRLVFVRRFFLHSTTSHSIARMRAAFLLGALALAKVYRPQRWSDWMRMLLGASEAAPSAAATQCSDTVCVSPPPREALASLESAIALRPSDPLISILVPVFNPPERYLREMIASVQAQSYPHWELCLADDASTEPHVRQILAESARTDLRIKTVYRPTNGHISRATNSALELAHGKFVALLDHDDLLAPDALWQIIGAIRANPAAQFLYTNRDKIDDDGRHFDPENRGAWNPAMATTHNYLHHLTVIDRKVVLLAGAFRADYFGSQDLDLYLRCHELLQPDQIVYVPVIGYHWRAHAGSTATRGDQKDYMFDSARRAIVDALQRRGLRASPFLPEFGPFYGMNLHQLHWDPGILRENPVSIVVAVPPARRDSWRRCIEHLDVTLAADCRQIIVVSEGALDHPASRGTDPETDFVVAPAGTCLADLYNRGAIAARHRLLLLLDPGVWPVASGWLEDLAGWLSVPGVSATGPKLIATDGLLASAGWTVDHATQLPRALFTGDAVADLVPPFLSHSARDSLLLDPTCILTHTAVFRSLGGYASRDFPEHHFAANYCLRLHERRHRVVFTPQAILHTDAATPVTPTADSSDENSTFQLRHPNLQDPWIRPIKSSQRASDAELIPAARRNWMPEDSIAFSGGWFFLEHPYPGEKIQAGHQVLGGWCFAHPDKSIAELRVRNGTRWHLADLGQPRPDLAALVGFSGEIFPAGFSLELALLPGRSHLQFEAYLTGIGWQPVCTVEMTVLPQYALTRPARSTPITKEHFTNSLELLVEQTAHAPIRKVAQSARDFARDAANLTGARHPAQPFYGFVDQPGSDIVPFYSEIDVLGWLFHESQPLRRVVASFELTHWVELLHEEESPDIGRRFPENPRATHCRILGRVTVPQDLPQPRALRIWAELADGSWHLVFILRSRMHALGLTDLGTVHGVSSRDLAQAALILRLAFSTWRVRGPSWFSLGSIVTELRRRFPGPVSHRKTFPPTIAAPPPAAAHLLLVSHNLNREGAPLFLLELARYCHNHLETALSIVSPFDGALRSEFEALGAAVRIVDRIPLWSARTAREADAALDNLARGLHADEASLVIANTIESFWAVPAAARAGRPSLLYVHEPGVLGVHYLKRVAPEVRRMAAATLAQTTCASFLNEATQAYYREFSPGENYRIQPGWTQLTPSAARPTPAARERLRTRLGFSPHERVVINVGTVCPRKGQLFFIHAIEHLWRTQPELAARCRFLLIGAHDNHYASGLRASVAGLRRTNIELIPPTSRVQDYFGSADLFVLSSFEEGFSRVLLEAMAFELPIVSTSIHGVAEISRPNEEAILVPPGDARAMAVAMQQLLQDETSAIKLGRAARLRLQATFTAERVMPAHLATIINLTDPVDPMRKASIPMTEKSVLAAS